MGYQLGAPIRASWTFMQQGVLVDLATVTLRLRYKPDGTITSYAAAHDSLGTYHADIPGDDLAVPGTYIAIAEGKDVSGDLIGAEELEFHVDRSAF